MTEQNKNRTGSNKPGRFDIPAPSAPPQAPAQPTQPAQPAQVNNANNNPPKNRFSFDNVNQNINPQNTQSAIYRNERFNEPHKNFTNSQNNSAESKFAPKSTPPNDSRPKNATGAGGKFAIETNQNNNNNSNVSNISNINNETHQSQFANNDPPSMQTIQTKQNVLQPQKETIKKTTTIKKYLLPIDVPFEHLRLGVLLFAILPLTIYSYFVALEQIVYDWINNVDYSHGFIVIPLVVAFLYSRLDSYPGTRYRLCWLGMIPVLFCVFMRCYASWYYMDALEEWSLFFWVIGIMWFFYGTRAFLWALPSLCFLIFMFQLPFSVDVIMKHNLQLYAARFAAALLQILGEPAIAINNVIRVKGEILNVEAACSGIRFLISVFAIASAAVLFMRKPWWQNLIVMLIAAPLAIFINASRITLTGILLLYHRDLLSQFASKERISVLADEIAGYTMIIIVAIVFLLFLIYMDKVFKRVNI
ncbi:MAG: exosortase/archaeosortase family protein [Planctomycetaceae bacterium]|jgi:exosortase|nr:exosortase/archaeosortase family protein [Planctomycetaceae bacterium]